MNQTPAKNFYDLIVSESIKLGVVRRLGLIDERHQDEGQKMKTKKRTHFKRRKVDTKKGQKDKKMNNKLNWRSLKNKYVNEIH